MLFHRKRIKTDNLKLTIGQGTLKQTSQCKYLGLIIDNKLNWAAHVAHVKSKISKCVGILMKARPCLTRTFKPTIFSAEKNSKNYNFFCILGPYCSNFSETEITTFM